MKSVLKATTPDLIEFTLSITMTLRDWKKFKDHLTGSYPDWRIESEINQMVHKANSTFVPEEEREK